MQLAGQVTCMEDLRNAKFWSENLKGRDNLKTEVWTGWSLKK
jgi:hypothetical protein